MRWYGCRPMIARPVYSVGCQFLGNIPKESAGLGAKKAPVRGLRLRYAKALNWVYGARKAANSAHCA